jgi:hypothetical protein
MKKIRIGLDIDDVIVDFWGAYIKKFGNPKSNEEITRNVERKLRTDRDFWVNLELLNKPNFAPELYCTKRVNPKSWTKTSLMSHELNIYGKLAPVYQMYYQLGKKSTMIKGRVDVFVDDSVSNFIEMNLNGVPCLLMSNERNAFTWDTIGRIYSLDYYEIEDTYELLVNTIGKNFKRLL